MQMLIDGTWVDADQNIPVHDPFTGEVIDTVPRGTREDVGAAVEAAVEGYRINRDLPTRERSRILRHAAELLAERAEEFAVTIAREGSKTIREARKEVYRCGQTLRVSGEEATRIRGETIAFDQQEGSENRRGDYYRFPVGVIAAITPFNDPLNLVAHKVGPAIAGGNGVVVKPATVTPLSALKLAELLLRDHVLGQIKRWYGPDLIVTDGSSLLNMTAWARLYREEEPSDQLLSRAMGIMAGEVEGEEAASCFQVFPELKALKRLHLTHLHCPDGVLFLDVDPELSMERIMGRGEDRQVHETSEKLEMLRDGYRSVCRFLEPDWQVPARILDGHQSLEGVTESALGALRAMEVVPPRLLPFELVEDEEEEEFGSGPTHQRGGQTRDGDR